jgi:16S rRNA (cytosine967-C5)-methyltransferase
VTYVLEGTALPQALSRVFAQLNPAPSSRGAMQDIAYRTMRQVGRVDALITLMTSKQVEPPLLYSLLCCALTLLVQEEGAALPYEEFVVVDQAVNAAASHAQMVFGKGMVNAVLRRFLREQQSLLALALKQPAAQWNYPQWWIDQCKAAYPQEWQTILRSGNQAPPLTLRVNQKQTTVAAYLALLAQHGMSASQIGNSALRLSKPVPVAQIPGFEEGMVSVQDAAAQRAAELLDLQDGMSVLDACAAPGGKTGHILEIADVELLAIDVDAKRIQRIHDNLARLKLFASIKEGDAARSSWWERQAFDRIIADVPCTASGVVRRHPDIRWLRRKTDAAQLAQGSAKILDNLWRMLKPGGKLLLVTCSIWPVESEQQAAAFAARHQAIRLPAPGQLLPTSAENNDHDGLFYALFEKPTA